jgi:hypothetical protein
MACLLIVNGFFVQRTTSILSGGSKMKRILGCAVLSSLALAASLTVNPAAAQAAAAAPVLSVVNTKLADGAANVDGGVNFVADGINLYSAVKTTANTLKLVRSKDGGVTWGGAHHIYAAGAEGNLDQVSIAISSDAVDATKRILHVAWSLDNGYVYYAWADASNLDSWSAPVRLNDTFPGMNIPNVVATTAGKVFVKTEFNNQLYLMVADDYKTGQFTAPAPILDATIDGAVTADAEMALDASGNLHLSYPFCYHETDWCSTGGIKYTYLPAGSSTWQTPKVIFTQTNPGPSANHTGLAVYNNNTIYISTKNNDNLTFYGTTNGGNSWTKKTVFSKTTTQQSSGFSDITVNSNKAITIGTMIGTTDTNGTLLSHDVKVYRSTDGGASWSSATTIPNAGYLSIGVDGNGKLGVLTRSIDNVDSKVDGEVVTYFSKEK